MNNQSFITTKFHFNNIFEMLILGDHNMKQVTFSTSNADLLSSGLSSMRMYDKMS